MNRHKPSNIDNYETDFPALSTNKTKKSNPIIQKNTPILKSNKNSNTVVSDDYKYMIDIGCNLTSSKFLHNSCIDDVITRACKHNVKMQIITGTTIKNSVEAYKLITPKYDNILKCTVGIHPHNANQYNRSILQNMTKLLERDIKYNAKCKIVAIGETGLDYNRMYSTKEKQIESFRSHIELAKQFNKSLFLHERDAHHDFLEVLDSYDNLPPVVVHCFTGTRQELSAYIERGFYIGITGFICIEYRAREFQKYVNQIPLDKLMIETDAPYMKPTGSESTPTGVNEPYLLNHVANKLARLYHINPNAMIENVTKNTKKFFKI
jgi:TatD DNase family protein